jgi:NhaP-type Na+/H+ or K+/H+ antiporter
MTQEIIIALSIPVALATIVIIGYLSHKEK